MSELKILLATNIISLFLNILGKKIQKSSWQKSGHFVRHVFLKPEEGFGMILASSQTFPGKDPTGNTYSQVPYLHAHSLTLVIYQHMFSVKG